MDVAKTADGHIVLAQTNWNWHDAIGCYLTLDDDPLATLRNNAQSGPTAEPTPDPTVKPIPEPIPIPVSETGSGSDIVAVALTEGTHLVEVEAAAATG